MSSAPVGDPSDDESIESIDFETQDDLRSLAERVRWLIDTVPGPDGKRMTYSAIEARAKQLGHSITAQNVNYLATGKKTNPTKAVIEALADVFNVSASYFLDDHRSRQIRSQIELLAVMRNTGVRDLAMRAAALPEDRLRLLLDLAATISGASLAESKDESPEADR